MKGLSLSGGLLWRFAAAVAVTLAARTFIYTPDCNLLVMAATFAVAYLAVLALCRMGNRLRRHAGK